jgi:hypothetical protein
MGSIDDVYGVHDVMKYVFFPLELLACTLLLLVLVLAVR